MRTFRAGLLRPLRARLLLPPLGTRLLRSLVGAGLLRLFGRVLWNFGLAHRLGRGRTFALFRVRFIVFASAFKESRKYTHVASLTF
jgi:hypothetical protein